MGRTCPVTRAGCWCGPVAALFAMVLGLAAGAAPAAAQAILNAESLEPKDTAGLHALLRASGGFQTGNARVVQAAGGGAIGYRTGRHWLRIMGGLDYLGSRDSSLVNSRYIHVRYSFIFSSRLRTFHFWQLQSNQALLLKRRALLGTGLRLDVLRRNGVDAAIGTGLMYEWERAARSRAAPNDVVRNTTVRMANLAVFGVTLPSKAHLLSVTYFQPSLDAPSDYRALSDLALDLPLAGAIDVGMELEWRHDSRPPKGVQDDDFALRTTVTLRR